MKGRLVRVTKTANPMPANWTRSGSQFRHGGPEFQWFLRLVTLGWLGDPPSQASENILLWFIVVHSVKESSHLGSVDPA